MQFTNGYINDVLLVLEIFANLLSSSNFSLWWWENMKFAPHDVVIREVHNPQIVVSFGRTDHSSWLISSMVLSLFLGSSFIAYAHYLRRIWNEIFGHLNYRYLQQLRKLNLVLSAPKASCIDGVCLGWVLGKQNQNPFS